MKKLLLKLFRFVGVEIEKHGKIRVQILPFNWLISITILLISINLIFGSWFSLKKTEKASVEIFGKYYHEVGPGGIYFKIPFITTVRKVETEVRHRWELGFRTKQDADRTNYVDVPEEATMLTKGGHLGSVYWIIQYTINDCYNWLYQLQDPQATLDLLGQGSMRHIIGQTGIDALLTTEKNEIQEKNKKLLQSYCDLVGMKVTINEVKLQDCTLPDPDVQKAYDGVMNAIKEKERMKNDAQGYANKIIPEAEGTASRILNEAKSYSVEQINGAKAEVARFDGIYKEYQKDPITTKEKLWFEAMQEVMPNGKKTIMDKETLITIKNK